VRNGGWIRAKRPSTAFLIVPWLNHPPNSQHVTYTKVTQTQIFQGYQWLLRAGKVQYIT
jgi:hypothetical protein